MSDRAAIFFDRDGTLNEEVGYAGSLDRFHVYPFAAEAVRRVNQAGLLAILITNQAGVARGYFPESAVHDLFAALQRHLAEQGAFLDAMYYCPHHPEAGVGEYLQVCNCRKPKPGLLQRAANDFHLNLAACALVSDRSVDIGMAQNLGLSTALVLTGYGQRDHEQLQSNGRQAPDVVAPDALAAVDQILSRRLVGPSSGVRIPEAGSRL